MALTSCSTIMTYKEFQENKEEIEGEISKETKVFIFPIIGFKPGDDFVQQLTLVKNPRNKKKYKV